MSKKAKQLNPDALDYWSKEVFPDIVFTEKGHKYLVKGVQYPSVSTVLKNFYDEFPLEFMAQNYAKKHGFRVKDVKDAWSGKSKLATDRGTIIHLFAEGYAKWKWYGIGKRPKVTCKQTLGVVQFWESLPDYMYPVGLEVQMFSEQYGFTGTGDIWLYNERTEEYMWLDWKSNESLFSEYPQKPLKHLPKELGLVQDNYGKYTCQLSLYSILMEDAGFNPTQRVIIWLREQEDKKLYKTFRTQDVREHLRPFLEENKYNFLK